MQTHHLSRPSMGASIWLILILCNTIICDHQQATTSNSTEAVAQLASSSNQTLAKDEISSASNSSSEYKQQPMPNLQDSSTKISYDIPASTLAPLNVSSASDSTSSTSQLSQVDHSTSNQTELKTSLLEHRDSNSNLHESQPSAEFLVSSDTLEAASVSSLDDSPLDLDAAFSTSSSVVARHGRASSPGNYQPPATSRLSHYSPSLLQNSRGHSRNDQSAELVESRPKPTTPFDPIIVCYLGSWSVYRPSLAKFTPENINPFLCTHLIYAFAGLSSKYELKPFDSYNDITQGGYRKFTSLKEHNKQLKTLIAVGGWNEGSAR